MTIEYIAPLERALARTKTTLFQPFDLGKWFVIGFGAWLAYLASSDLNGSTGGSWGRGGQLDDAGRSFAEILPQLLAVIVLALFVALALGLVILWVSSRGQFIFLDNAIHNRGAVAAPWREYAREGNSLFLWQLVLFVLVLMVMALPIAGLFLAGWRFRDDFSSYGCGEMILAVLFILSVGLVVGCIRLFLFDFVVPLMRRHRVSTTEGWQLFLPVLRKDLLGFLLYALLVLLLKIVVGMALTALVIFTCCVAAIPLVLPYVNAVFLLPVLLTYRFFSLEFLRQFVPDLESVPASPES